MPHPDLLFGSTPTIVRLVQACARYALIAYPILILGEAGVGKTALARHIHALGSRIGDFVSCSMAGIPTNLEHSYLCGHARGAFTGADSEQPGIIEAAHRGTLFLDELALASPKVQEILLEVLDENTFRRVGEIRRRPVHVRLMAATNADLDGMVAAGSFRRDLLGRFGYLRIHLPPLRERRDEILPLVEHYLWHEACHVGRASPPRLSETLREAFLTAPWQDNVREVRAVCQYLVVHAPPERPAELADLPAEFISSLGDVGEMRVQSSRAELAWQALRQAAGNKTQAARQLGISRRHLYRLLGHEGGVQPA